MLSRAASRCRNSIGLTLFVACCLLSVPGPSPLAQEISDGTRELDPNRARVFVTSNPSRQAITQNGRSVDASTPATLDLLPGQHSLTVKAAGYEPLTHEFSVRAGQQLSLRFILRQPPPEAPTPAELREIAALYDVELFSGNAPLDPEQEAARRKTKQRNDACLECHPLIPKLHSAGAHRTMACADCHGTFEEHVQDGKVVAEMPAYQGGAIQISCLACHDRDNRNRSQAAISGVSLPEHLEEKRVRLDTLCEQCHHVHAPQKWVHEAREMVGLPRPIRTLPMMSETLADAATEQFEALIETFLVIPVSIGVIGKIAFAGDRNYPADAFLVSGVGLIAGSYLAGKFFYSRKLASIRAVNIERTATNDRAQEYNDRLQRAMTDYYESFVRWEEDSSSRGVVTVIEY